MNKQALFAWSAGLASVLLLVSAFVNKDDGKPKLPKERVREQVSADVDHLLQLAEALVPAWAATGQNPRTLAGFRHQFTQVRLAYKRLEYLAEYYEPELVKLNINGAPLPKHNPGTEAARTVEEPLGLQILDELIFGEEALAQRAQIQTLLTQLKLDLRWFNTLKQRAYSDRELLEACRLSLLRTFTLGLTGFDCPGSVNSLAEARVGLDALSQTTELFLPYTSSSFAQKCEEIKQTFAEAKAYLQKHQNFEKLDRLEFLVQYTNPLYASLLDLQNDLGIEQANLRQAQSRPWNSTSRNLFDEGFLNPYYYTALAQKKDREQAAELGKLLFFDPVISDKGERSCASCHDPRKAFTDGQTKSLATDQKGTVERNAPTCIDAVFADRYFYDLRAEVLEEQVEHVVYSQQEFATSYPAIVQKLSQSQEYVSLFQGAFPEFGPDPINQGSIASALAAYVATLTSFQSPFDRHVRGESPQLPPRPS
ncbi:MAG: hypothetical protein HC842_02555, partial [Cytophagales bacterium]|nr:hypothetical protein [Cytophagales bacterium]